MGLRYDRHRRQPARTAFRSFLVCRFVPCRCLPIGERAGEHRNRDNHHREGDLHGAHLEQARQKFHLRCLPGPRRDAANGLECTANANARTDSASSCQECRTCTSITADPGFFFSNPRDETRHAGQRNPDPGGAIGDLIGDLVGGFFNQEQIE